MPFIAPADDLAVATGPRFNQFGDPIVGTTPTTGRQAQDLGDAIIAGLQSSATGLAIRGKMPSVQLPQDAPWYQRISAGAGSVVGDLPLSIAAGAVASPTGPVGTMAAAFAAPMALREALVEAYNNDHAMSWAGVWDIALAALKGGGKGAVIGAATGGAGRLATPFLAPAGRVATAVGATGAELTALTATSAAVEQHMPTWQDFMDNAILLGGMKGAVGIAKGLRSVYAETGRTPDKVLADAARDPEIAKELADRVMPKAYESLALDERIKAAIDTNPNPEALRTLFNEGGKPLNPLGEGKPVVSWEYVADGDTARGVLRAATELYGPEVEAQRRGVVTNADSLKDAQALLNQGKTGPHEVGAAGNSGEVLMRAALLRDALNHTYGELTKIVDVAEADLTPNMKLKALAAIERVAMLNAEFAGVRAEAGRTLQIFQALKRDGSFMGEAETLLKLAERKGKLQDIAALAMRLKDPEQLAGFIKEYTKATTTEKVLEVWKSFILSGPMTHLANMMGNTAKWMLEVPESMVAATFTAAERKLAGDPLSMAQFKARALAPLYGLQMGAKDALTISAEVWRGSGEHVEKADVFRGAVEGRKGEIIRLPFKALQVEDVLFRTVAERSEAHLMAVDRATKGGLHPDTAEFREAVQTYTTAPETGLSDAAAAKATARIQQAGAEGVFSQRLGPRLETLQRAMAGHWSQLIIPFVRTPANLVSWAVQHVPGLNLMSGRWRADYAAGGEARSRAVARVVIGAGLTTMAYTLAQDGLITGGGQFDPEQRRTKNAAGWQPYSVKIHGEYYSYQRLEPVAKVLGIAADLVELQAATKDGEDKAKIAAMLVLMFGNATVSTTYLSGLSNAMNSLTDPERYGGNFIEQYASSVVPKIIGQPTMMADPYKREVDGVMDAIQAQIPLLREKLLPKRDVWGEPVKNERWFGVMPVATSVESHDKVKTEAVRLQIAIADAPRFITEKGPFNPKDKRLEIQPEQRDIMREVSGKNAMMILAPIVNAPDWVSIPDFAKAEIYKRVIQGTRLQGAYAALPPDDAARVELRQKIVDRVIKESQAAGSR